MTGLVLVKNVTPEIIVMTLNRPEKRNALNVALMQEFLTHLDVAEKNLQTRILIIRGAGTLFSAGLDLEEARNPTLTESLWENVSQVLQRILHSPLVTIALAHGSAIAGGAGLLAACDFTIGTPQMKIGFPEIKRGLLPALISTLLVRQIGWRNLRELFLLGDMITGTRAAEIGLLNQVVPEDELETAGFRLVEQILEGAPLAIRLTKKLLNALHSKDLKEEIALAQKFQMEARNSPEVMEGIRAFQENRKPQWTSQP